MKPIEVGDYVEVGERGTSGYDRGTVKLIDGSTAVVTWDDEETTSLDVSGLRVIGRPVMPCPFCGSASIGRVIKDPKVASLCDNATYVKCSDCKASGPVSSGDDAATIAWNKVPRGVSSGVLVGRLRSIHEKLNLLLSELAQ